MNLVIDIGNTKAKLGIFQKDQLIKTIQLKKISEKEILKLHSTFPEIKNAILCSVASTDELLMEQLSKHFNLFIVHPGVKIPFKNLYETPQTLGVDRIAAVAGAVVLFPKRNILVVDAGTCIKYNFTNSKNEFMGGGISPGLKMRFKAMHTFTAKLPMVHPDKSVNLIGKNTEESLQSGGLHGANAEVEGIIDRYSKKYKNLKVILTGGSADFFADRLKNSIFASPNLILIGLNTILNLNVRK